MMKMRHICASAAVFSALVSTAIAGIPSETRAADVGESSDISSAQSQDESMQSRSATRPQGAGERSAGDSDGSIGSVILSVLSQRTSKVDIENCKRFANTEASFMRCVD